MRLYKVTLRMQYGQKWIGMYVARSFEAVVEKLAKEEVLSIELVHDYVTVVR